ncbi:hypothetical protein DFH09DRAFT_1038184, partial [Mycena vulgaris]
MLRSASEMLVHYRETIGDIPPRLIGASTTLAGSKLYLFGGSLASASETRLLSTLYAFDLELCKWERIIPAVDDAVPKARYFHTADIWNNHLVVFGGLGARGNNPKSEQLQVLNDVRLFNIATRRWLPPAHVPAISPLTPVPRPRSAHLSGISSSCLFIFGGKDFFGEVLDDVCVYDLAKKEWIQKQRYIPTFDFNHAFAVTSRWHVRVPPSDPPRTGDADSPEHPVPLSYSERTTSKSPSDIYIYHSDDPQPRLEVLSPLSNADIQLNDHPAGAVNQPPSLQFPSGGILGNRLILAGNSPAENKEHLFSIWTLDLVASIWSPISTNDFLKKGSWAKGCLWQSQNKFIVFGNRAKPFLASNKLVLSWDEVAVVDLEAMGIYQPPPLILDAANQRLGLASLAEDTRADFDFLCEDGRRIPCRRKLIMERWPWFCDQLARLDGNGISGRTTHGKRTEIAVTQTSCSLSQSYPVTMALVQYFHTMALGTALQRAPAVLSYLLLISTEFQIPHLLDLVKHAMHLALSEATAAGVYEIAASCGCRSLQIRAFAIHANRNKTHGEAGVASRPAGRARSNSEGIPNKQGNRSDGIRPAPTGFAPSAFTQPLHAITSPAAENKVAPVSPSSALVTRRSDPVLPKPPPRESLPSSPKKPQQANDTVRATVLMSKYNQVAQGEKPTAGFQGQRKRSQSVGAASRIPRPASRLEQTSPFKGRSATPAPVSHREETAVSTVPVLPSEGPRPIPRSIRSAQHLQRPRVEGPRDQVRGRRMGISVTPKGEDNGRGKR